MLRTGSKEGSKERFKSGTPSKTTICIKKRFKGGVERKVQSGTLSKTISCIKKRFEGGFKRKVQNGTLSKTTICFSEKVTVVATWITVVILELIHTSNLGFAERLCLLDTELSQVLPGHVVIHDNLTNHVALPTMRHSSF